MEYFSIGISLVSLFISVVLLFKFNTLKNSFYEFYAKNIEKYEGLKKEIDEAKNSIVESGSKNRKEIGELAKLTKQWNANSVETEKLIVANFRNFINYLGYVIDDRTLDWKFFKEREYTAMLKKERAEINRVAKKIAKEFANSKKQLKGKK